MDWQPIDTLQEGVEALLFTPGDKHPIWVGSFRWVAHIEESLESESRNAKGRRKIIQEYESKEREWDGEGWSPSHWMPLPAPPTTK
jgi:hypothetical protein